MYYLLPVYVNIVHHLQNIWQTETTWQPEQSSFWLWWAGAVWGEEGRWPVTFNDEKSPPDPGCSQASGWFISRAGVFLLARANDQKQAGPGNVNKTFQWERQIFDEGPTGDWENEPKSSCLSLWRADPKSGSHTPHASPDREDKTPVLTASPQREMWKYDEQTGHGGEYFYCESWSDWNDDV